MTLMFSESMQSFYDLSFNYVSPPDDMVEVNEGQHDTLLALINEGRHLFSDFTYSAPRPSQFHVWDEGNLRWIDPRTDEEIAAHERSLLAPLNKRQFNLYMFDHQLTDSLNAVFTSYPREKVEFDSTDRIERLSPTVKTISDAMGWTDEQVDLMWKDALAL